MQDMNHFALIRTWWPFGFLSLILIGLLVMIAAGGNGRIVSWYLIIGLLPFVGGLYFVATLVRMIWIQRVTAAILSTFILSLAAIAPFTWSTRIWPVAFPADVEIAAPSLTIRVPTDQPMRVAWGGDGARENYHAFTSDQRWAYDLVIVPYFNSSQILTDYGCYGVPVLAPIDGEIVQYANTEPEAEPGTLQTNISSPYGNHVVIEPNSGGYLILAHLKTGSVTVRPGDSVQEGDVIGACGNSGNTSEPHIHVHYQREHPKDVPMNFAQGLPLYFRDHSGPPMPVGGLAMKDGRITALGDIIQHQGNEK